MNDPRVSVILVVKNGERFLSESIESVLNSGYANLEIIVIDGDSTDRTPVIARSFDAVRYFRQGKPGLAQAYNEGLQASTGEFIAFQSADDLWQPRKLSVQVAYLQRHPETLYVVCKFKFFLEAGCDIPPGFRKRLLDTEQVGWIPETFVGRKTFFDRVGLFDARYKVAGDLDLFARANDLKIPVGIIEDVLLLKRVHRTNTSLTARENETDLLHAVKRSIDRKRGRSEEERSRV